MFITLVINDIVDVECLLSVLLVIVCSGIDITKVSQLFVLIILLIIICLTFNFSIMRYRRRRRRVRRVRRYHVSRGGIRM